jgi:hypothetical protein
MKISLSVALGGGRRPSAARRWRKGVPVSCTFNTSSVVNNKVEEYVFEAWDAGAMVSWRGFLREWWRGGSFFGRMREALKWLDGEDSALTRKVQSGKEQS